MSPTRPVAGGAVVLWGVSRCHACPLQHAAPLAVNADSADIILALQVFYQALAPQSTAARNLVGPCDRENTKALQQIAAGKINAKGSAHIF